MAFSYRLLRFERCLSASERPTSAVKNETKSVVGITSHQMEGAARHMELPSTIPILSKLNYIYEYMFACQRCRVLMKKGLSLCHIIR